jgi:hypothetical protein
MKSESLQKKVRSARKRELKLDEDGFPPLTRAQKAELERRIRDMDDPHRYMIISALFSRKRLMFYEVSENVFAMGDIAGGTLFKRKEAAEAVFRTLGRETLQVIKVKKTKKGIRLVDSVKPWCPQTAGKLRKGGISPETRRD